MWPAYVVLTLLDGVLLSRVPLSDSETEPLFGMVLVAGFINLFTVAVVAPVVAVGVRRVRRDLPWPVSWNYTGTALLALVAAYFAARAGFGG